jgi:hypothetical protein
MASHIRILPVALAFAAPLIAQSPVITQQGDPTIKSDTIYRLAVDPAKHPERTTAVLLDDGVVRVEADGRTTRTYRMVTQILKSDAEEDYQEQSFSYAPGHERMTVNWVRVVRPDGTVISSTPSHVQDSDVPAQHGDPVYSDRKVRRLSLTGVKAGTIVDWSYTIEDFKPFLTRDFFLTWSVNPGAPVARSRYIVDVPASLTPRIVEENLDFARTTQVMKDRRVYTWARADIPAIRPEALAADSNGVYMSITIGSPLTWSDISSWYASNAKARYTLTPAIEAKVRELVRSARTQDDSIRAIHRWVAQDIRYVSIALGLGGYQPRSPEEVVRTGFGDCKDKATLFIAALAKLGIPAFPVLLNSEGGVRRQLPTIDQFDHAIAAVRRGGRYEYTDLTADLTPYGTIPFSYQGEFGIVVKEDGSAEEITFPLSAIDSNRVERLLLGTLANDGSLSGSYSERVTGIGEAQLRETFRHPMDSTTRANFATNLASKLIDGAVGDSVEAFRGPDLSADARVKVMFRNGRAAQSTGSSAILKLPLPNVRSLADAARQLEQEPPRRFPISAMKFWGYRVVETELRYTLPEGWRAELPRGVEVDGVFGKYQSHYAQTGQNLVVRRRITGSDAVVPPEGIKDFIAWLRDVARDDVEIIVLQKNAQAAP